MNKLSHVLISASAGTGKTFQLSNRYIALLYQGVAPDQILATTFTRKAAGEILDRVIVRLATATLQSDARDELARWLPAPSLSAERCQDMLRQMLRYLHRVRVSTLDAFFAQLAGSFSLELALPPGWRIVEESYERYLRDDAIARTLQRHSAADVQRLMHLMAKGETQQSVSGLVRSTVEKLYSLYMETDAAAWQKIPRPKLLDDAVLAALIDQLRTAALPEHAKAAEAHTKDVAAAATGDWETFLSRGLAAKVLAGETTYSRKPIPPETVEVYQRLLAQASAVLLDQVAQQTEATYELLDKFHQVYAQLIQQTGALRFDDITRTLAVHGQVADVEQQQFRLDTSIAHLLLDEFQDTSLAQWQVLRPLARRLTSPGSADAARALPPSFLCVGDTKQAIYAWRGGKSEIFDALPRELTGLVDQRLSESHRSSQPVIDTVNTVFQGLTRHGNLERLAEPVAAWCQEFPPHTTVRGDYPGYVELSAARAAEDEEDDEDSAKFAHVAARVEELVAQAPGCSVGVLTRRNEVVKRLINELRQRGVAASEEGGNPLTDSRAGQVILSLLGLADHPGDRVARFHVAQSPLAAHLEYPDHTDEARTLAVAQDVRVRLLHAGYGRAIQHWAALLEPSCDQHDASRLQQFVELAYGYEPLATLRTRDFRQYVELKRVADPTTAEVRVMTVHQAKGLQFGIVVLPDLDARFPGQPDAFVVGQSSATAPIDCVCMYRNESIQKLLPPALQRLFDKCTQQSVDEALCVLYVALTRAIYSLYMIVKPTAARERNQPKTAAGLVRAALTDGHPLAPGETAYTNGDPRWYERLPAPQVAASPRHAARTDRPVKLAPMDVDSRLDFVSPSQLEGGARVPASSVLELGSAWAKTRGTLMHAWFERITWLDDAPLDRPELQRVAAALVVPGLDIDAQLADFLRMLDKPDA